MQQVRRAERAAGRGDLGATGLGARLRAGDGVGHGVAAPQGEVLVKAADVPVGGGTVITDKKVVVTQPKAGEFKAFSAVCTHQGCLVNSVSDGTINCPCHGSKFRITDASVAHGPAKKPLPPRRSPKKTARSSSCSPYDPGPCATTTSYAGTPSTPV